ncbi:LysR family transcriptional regulator [Hydrogenophaga sp. IBVHS2]|uniref:LysR family transcriptional regulator n=1 Tax=Hydrogenophaga sp. IBVHS2 TaxID=1985170 RepID=UPI000A2E2B40|nr:LysR family transcriptional regulator [Hydrogenophaga sp. IBVHS2]OSZ67819.1 LysR family transcriptional regulator [Hydrogenophaga sp. IBVHS2]
MESTTDRPDLEMAMAIRLHGSLALAARQLGVTPSAITRRLAALEARLGVRLFQRTTRRVSATAEGEAFCERAAALLQGFAALEGELLERRAEASGPIRLVATLGFGRRWLGPELAAFQTAHPGVQIEVQLSESLHDLAVEGFDGAIWLWDAPGRHAGEWVSRRLAPNQRVLVAAPAYLARRGTPRTPDDLAGHDCLVVRENTGPGGQRFDHWRLRRSGDEAPRHVAVEGPLQSNSGELVRDWCLAGHGIMLRSLWDVAPLLASGELVRVLPAWSMPEADILWLAPWRPRTPRRIALLVDHLVRSFKGQPWKPLAAPTPVSAARARPGSHRTR